jgi:hypothetical protein
MLVLGLVASAVAMLVRVTMGYAKRRLDESGRPGGPTPHTVAALASFNNHLARCPRCDLELGRSGLCAEGAELYRRKEQSEMP